MIQFDSTLDTIRYYKLHSPNLGFKFNKVDYGTLAHEYGDSPLYINFEFYFMAFRIKTKEKTD